MHTGIAIALNALLIMLFVGAWAFSVWRTHHTLGRHAEAEREEVQSTEREWERKQAAA